MEKNKTIRSSGKEPVREATLPAREAKIIASARLPICFSTIRTVSYRAASDADTRMESCAQIESNAMFELGKPKPRGVFDANMGTTESAYTCATCQLGKDQCHGHPGNFELKYPCISPIAIPEIKKWLKIICFSCGNPVIAPNEIQAILGHTRSSERLDVLVKRLPNLRRICAVCKLPHPIVRRPDKGTYSFIVKDLTVDGTPIDIPLYPHQIEEIFSRIRDETVRFLGRDPLSHPRSFIWRTIYIPPPAIRPDSKRIGGRGSGNDSITAHLKNFIHFHASLDAIPTVIDAKFAASINTLNEMLADILTRGTDNAKSIAMRLKGKHGRFRDNLLGKRAFGMGRSTIDGSPRLNLDQISIPLFIAQTLQIEETVQDFNRERLLPFVMNGLTRYPGCSCIKKRGSSGGGGSGGGSGKIMLPDAPGLQLENGDVVMRDLINGDYVAFNRQPTLTLSNITSVRVVIDRTALANGMSVLICPFFNADFDGDQMNVFNYSKAASLNEQIMMTRVASRMVSSTTGAMSIGQSGDSMIGLTKITQSGVRLNKYHAGLIFGSTICMPHLEQLFREWGREASVRETGPREASVREAGTISGCDIVSMALQQTPINFRGRSAYYDPKAPWMNWMPKSPEDATIEIVAGRLRHGCMDKPNTGAGARSIYQVMVHEFGQLRTLDAIYDMQQIGINFLSQHGFTTGASDFHIDPVEREKIVRTAQGLLTKSYQITRNLNHGRIIPPVDKTVSQFYEEQQINALRVFDDFHEPIIRSIRNPRANGLFELMASGSKGELIYMCNMTSTVGLMLLGGERIHTNYGLARSLPYFQRFEESPEARGYCGTSFMQGISSVACIYNAMLARTDIITRALMTSITGDQNRKSIKSLESVITNNYRMTVKNRDIVSFVYGADYFDPRALETVQYGPALLSNADLEKQYHHRAANPSTNPSAMGAAFDAEFEAIRRDRDEYRRIFKIIENLTARSKMNADIKLPFNVTRLADRLKLAIDHEMPVTEESVAVNTQRASDAYKAAARESSAPREDLPLADQDAENMTIVKMVEQFCEEIPYLFINEDQYHQRGWVPPFVQSAATLIRMYVRAELSVKRIATYCAGTRLNARAFTTALIEGIRANIVTSMVDPGQAVGIIAAQSFSEPFTQAMLDAYKLSALGGNPARVKLAKCREIMNAYGVARLSNPMMTIVLDAEHAANPESAQRVAQRIEMLTLGQLVAASQIFYEAYGEPRHPAYLDERAMFAQFAADNPLLAQPKDLATWCLRFEIDKSMLVQKNISVSAVITCLRDKFADLYLVFTTERAARVVIRAYIRSAGLMKFVSRETETGMRREKRFVKSTRGIQESKIQDIYRILLGTIIRGIDGITITHVEKLLLTKVDESGAVVDAGTTYGIRTSGTNLTKVACVPGVNPNLTFSDAIIELAEVLGIEAARYRIIAEMRGLIEKCNIRHYMIYADEMTRTGRVTSIERGGLSLREANNVALRAGHAAPVQVFTEAALNARRDTLSGVSAPLTFGTIPRTGTLYNSFMIDPEVIKKYKKTAQQSLEDIW